jgi:hypothetical protein
VGTFRRMNVVFSTTSEAATTTIQLRNTSFTTPCLWNQMFTSHILHWCPQHLISSQSSLQFQLLRCLGGHSQTVECGATDLQIKQEWIPSKDISSAKFRWSQATWMSELLQWSHESNQPSQPWLKRSFAENHLTLSCVPT